MQYRAPGFLIAVISGIAMSQPAGAIIIGGDVTSGSGSFIELPLPFLTPTAEPDNTVGNDTFQNDNLYGFNEDQNIELAADLLVDVAAAILGSSTISSGTIVASHYIFFDPDGTTSQTGYVDFDSQILGILTTESGLGATDFLANTSVNYLSPTLRGLEAGDSASIDASFNYRLLVNWEAGTPGDYIRVLTAQSEGGSNLCSFNPPGVGGCPGGPVTGPGGPVTVPEPSALWLLGAGLFGLGAMRRRVAA